MSDKHRWESGPYRNGNPTMRCTRCGRIWMPDQSLRKQGKCRPRTKAAAREER